MFIRVNSVALSSDDQPIKGKPGSALRDMRKILPFPGGTTAIIAGAVVGAFPVAAPAMLVAVVAVTPLAVDDALDVAAGFGVSATVVVSPHAASTAAPAVAARVERKRRRSKVRRVSLVCRA